MQNFLLQLAAAAMVIHVALIAICIVRVWRGRNIPDRLVSADVVGTLLLALLVLMSIWLDDGIYLDAALALAALGSIGTIALARYSATHPEA